MATVKKTAVRKKSPVKKVVEKSTLTSADIVIISEIAAKAAVEAVKAATKPQPTTPGPEIIASKPMTPEVIAGMTEEEIQEFNDSEARKAAARKAVQATNREKFSNMSSGDRARALAAVRDPEVIRRATPPGWAGGEDDLVRVICRRRIGLSDGEMSDDDEVVDMCRVSAKNLQRSGAIEVAI